MSEIGKAYVQIIPTAEGISGKIEQEMGGVGEKSGSSFSKGFGKVLGGVGKVALGAVSAGAGAMAAVTKEAVSSFAEYEQLVGGVETLFGDVAGDVQENAKAAFASAGMSANEYMETVTGFAAALKNSLGDEHAWQMANYADMAVQDMSDNANKMGTSMESIQNAYQGFAKQNYTMLDNLKLGYGGTKQEMERLLRDAEELEGYEVGSLDISNFADIVDAIHIVQENMGITGTTANEAATTISGSLEMMKSSWENVVSALGGEDEQMLGQFIDNLVESAGIVAENMLPVIERAVSGISTLIAELAPVIAEQLPTLLIDALPGLLEAGLSVVQTLAEGILTALPSTLPTIVNLVIDLSRMIIDNLPLLLQTGLAILMELSRGLVEAIPQLIPAITQVIIDMAMMLTEPDMLIQLIEASLQIILALAEGIVEAIPQLIAVLPELINRVVSTLIDLAPALLLAAGKLVLTLAEGIVKSVKAVIDAVVELWNKLKETWTTKIGDVKQWGKDLIDSFIGGIMAKWEDFKATLSNLAGTVKDFLGFSEPKEGPLSNFHTFAPDMMDLFMSGIEEKTPELDQVIAQSFDLQPVIANSMDGNQNGQSTTNVNVTLQGDASKFFTVMREQNNVYRKMNGQSAFA